jgi:hypothetical protein
MSCSPPTIVVGGVLMSTSDFQNAQELLTKVSSAGSDPTLDEYEENVANGNNTSGKSGVLIPNEPDGTIPKQTTLPPEPSQRAKEINTKTPPGGNGTAISGTSWTGDYDQALSTNFQVRQFTINAFFPHQLIDYSPAYTAQVRFKNLQNVALNIAEPMLAKFGPFTVNSGIRNKTSGTSGLSQHITGQAIDIQFSGWSYARYWENAAWVKDNIRYDQFIFEHSSKGLAWYHLSFNTDGNRAPSIRTKVMTMFRNNFNPGLHRYG